MTDEQPATPPVADRTSAFHSDNCAGAHPRVLDAVVAASRGYAPAYGADRWTERALQLIGEQFGEQARAFLVFNGTAANVLSIRAVAGYGGGVICSESAHINVDEGGAPEAIAGAKLFTVAGADAKITAADIDRLMQRSDDEHQVQPRLVSISQSTEHGVCYSPAEVAAIAARAHERGLALHVDGARLCNAAVGLDVPLRALTTDAGVDVVSFGGTKVGLLGAEAVVLLNPELAPAFKYLRKQSLQLASKHRFLAAQFTALLEHDLWLTLAGQANAMARRLAAALADMPAVAITHPVQANAVFAVLPAAVTEALQSKWSFYVWDGASGEVRLMCSWDTRPEDVDDFVLDLRAALSATGGG